MCILWSAQSVQCIGGEVYYVMYSDKDSWQVIPKPAGGVSYNREHNRKNIDQF
jgi:hypothetical protein